MSALRETKLARKSLGEGAPLTEEGRPTRNQSFSRSHDERSRSLIHSSDPRSEADAQLGIKSGPSEAKPKAFDRIAESLREDIGMAKRGRPRLGEDRDKPWVIAGMSRRTWYRRKAEGKLRVNAQLDT